MLGVEALPALVYTLCSIGIPESPRWLIGFRKDYEQAAEALAQLNPEASSEEVHALIDKISQAAEEEERVTGGALFSWSLSRPITLAFLIAFFSQVSGINVILYFAPRIFQMAGISESASQWQSVGIGLTNLVFTIVGLGMIDRLGRKTILLIGANGLLGSLTLCSWSFSSGATSIAPYCIFTFIASFAIGPGCVLWVYISEIFPNEHRAIGNAIGSGSHWVCNAVITFLFPVAIERFEIWQIFAFCAVMMATQVGWVLLAFPETRGVPLEEIQRKLGIS